MITNKHCPKIADWNIELVQYYMEERIREHQEKQLDIREIYADYYAWAIHRGAGVGCCGPITKMAFTIAAMATLKGKKITNRSNGKRYWQGVQFA